MALLPCLRWGDARWWLPLQAVTADALGQQILQSATDRRPERRREAAAVIRARLVRDPALLIFAGLRWLEAHPQAIACHLSDARLARWLAGQLPRIFAAGDALLGAPRLQPSHRRRWADLHDRFLRADPAGWLDAAAVWLQVTGPAVPLPWQASWPQIDFHHLHELSSADAAETHADADADLAGAAGEAGEAEEDAAGEDAAGEDAAGDVAGDVAAGETFSLARLSLETLARNVAQQRALRERFQTRLQREKMASLKQFAYGLSHEINNPLANIATRCKQLSRQEPDPQRVASLERVVDQAMRAHEMIADVMFFAHPPRPQQRRICVAEVVAAVTAEHHDSLANMAIDLQLSATVPASATSLVADPGMLADALRALLRNAAEAIGCDGRIVVSLRRRRKSLMIQVADSGPGLSEEACRHAFDPYYSGREAGRGLGLGLCRVYRIAKLHHGGVSLASGPAGCLARVWLPTPS